MADFVQTMKDWRRMCDTIQSENQRKSTGGWCKGCPLQGLCVIDTSIKDSTIGEFEIIGAQIQAWAADHPEPEYPSWGEWFVSRGMLPEKWDDLTSAYMNVGCVPNLIHLPIPADIAEKLGLQPKEGTC